MGGDRTIGGFSRLPGGPVSVVIPLTLVSARRGAALAAERLAHLCPARRGGQGGTPPLPLEVWLDALGAVVLDGLSYRRAARMVGICKTEVGDSLDPLLGELAAPRVWPASARAR